MRDGLTEDRIAQLDAPDAQWTPREALALELAERLATDHRGIDDELFDRLRAHFSEPEILELGMMAGQYVGFGRLIAALGLEPKSCPVE